LPVAALLQERESDLQTDASAALAMSRAGFDPSALLRYIDRMQPPDQAYLQFPPRETRIAALQETIGGLPPKAYTTSDQFDVIRKQAHSEGPEPTRPALKMH
jgi:predicted Zn-dependent protease